MNQSEVRSRELAGHTKSVKESSVEPRLPGSDVTYVWFWSPDRFTFPEPWTQKVSRSGMKCQRANPMTSIAHSTAHLLTSSNICPISNQRSSPFALWVPFSPSLTWGNWSTSLEYTQVLHKHLMKEQVNKWVIWCFIRFQCWANNYYK